GAHAERAHGQVVVATQRQRGGVHHAQVAADGFLEGEVVDAYRGGIGTRVGGVDPVHAVLAHEDLLAVRLQGTLDRHSVGGEVRHPGTGAEDHGTALLQVPDGTQR